MPKVTAATVAVATLLALTLTGCAGGSESAGDAPAVPETSESVSPLVAETPTPQEGGDTDAFVKAFRDLQATYPSTIPDATDEQLVAAGREACTRLAAGEPSTDISLIEGEQRNPESEMYTDSVTLVGLASTYLCR